MRKNILLIFSAICLFSMCTQSPKKESRIKNDPEMTTQTKPAINFYIENSVSMDGYLKGATGFRQDIISYLNNIKLLEVTDSLNFFYINTADKPNQILHNASLDVISDFAGKFELKTFQKEGGSGRGYTDIAAIIKKMLGETMPNTISILVSDFIFSPDATTNPQEYLFNQQIGIKNTMVTRFEKVSNPAFVVYQLQSEFDGPFFYFDKSKGKEVKWTDDKNKDKNKDYKGIRPFYIWIIGDVKNVSELCQKVPETKFKGQNEERKVKIFSIMAGNKEVNYAVKPNSGNFDLSRKSTKTDIDNLAKDSRTGKVNFSVNVDFSNLLLDDAYLTNADNYELNNSNYRMKVKTCPPNKHGYTHTLNFVADRIYKGTVTIKLKKEGSLPQWIKDADASSSKQTHDIDDEYGSQPELGKTYGIEPLIKGVFEGFTLKDKYYTEIKININ